MRVIIESMAAKSTSAQRQQQKKPQRFRQVDNMVALDNLFKEMHGSLEALDVKPGEYRLNPLTAEVITKKPTQVISSKKVTKQEYDEAQELLGACFPIKNLDAPPPDKYELPMTSSQEYGWCSKPLVKTKKLFNHPHHKCEITKFAETYFECMKTTPYSKGGRGSGPHKKQQKKSTTNTRINAETETATNTGTVVNTVTHTDMTSVAENQTENHAPPLPAPT